MKYPLYLGFAWLSACSVDSAIPEQSPVTPSAEEAQAETRNLLRSRLDLAGSSIKRVAAEAIADDATKPSTEALQAALLSDAGFIPASIRTQGSSVVAESALQSLEFDPVTRTVSFTDQRPYDVATIANVTGAALEQRSASLLMALGISSQDSGKPEVVSFGGEAKSLSGGDSVKQRLGTKVFYIRQIGGVRVPGHRMVFSYAKDGSLRAMRGQWPKLDIPSSKLSTTLSDASIVERALDTLILSKANAQGSSPIHLETFLVPDEGVASPAVKLRAAALLQAEGPDGPGRGVRYEFDL